MHPSLLLYTSCPRARSRDRVRAAAHAVLPLRRPCRAARQGLAGCPAARPSGGARLQLLRDATARGGPRAACDRRHGEKGRGRAEPGRGLLCLCRGKTASGRKRGAEGSGRAGERRLSLVHSFTRASPLPSPVCMCVCVCVCALSRLPSLPPLSLFLSLSLSVCVCVCPSMFLPRLPPAQLIEEILLAFCRDPALPQRSASPRPSPLIARNKNGQKCAFPPNGVPPFKGLADFVCPLCFVYAQPTEVCTPVPGP